MAEYIRVCKNKWCKAHFKYNDEEIGEKEVPKQCKKCISFSDNLSGGVSWEDKHYEGPRDDGRAHQISYKVTNYK